MTAMIKTNHKALTSTKKASLQKAGAVEKPITVKQVMILDTHDGAFIDQSVKVKPHKTNPNKLALKCTDLDRLMKAAKKLGLKACGAPVRGAKHWILIVWKGAFGEALIGQGSAPKAALDAGTTSPVKALKSAMKALPVKGVK